MTGDITQLPPQTADSRWSGFGIEQKVFIWLAVTFVTSLVFANIVGAYLFSDLCSGVIWALDAEAVRRGEQSFNLRLGQRLAVEADGQLVVAHVDHRFRTVAHRDGRAVVGRPR